MKFIQGITLFKSKGKLFMTKTFQNSFERKWEKLFIFHILCSKLFNKENIMVFIIKISEFRYKIGAKILEIKYFIHDRNILIPKENIFL